ncbi:family 1 encapsulin nanocompartment shell protein [Thermococcus atlanticus]
MLGLNPISISREKPFSKEETAQALRWAAIAELDAINFYEQFAMLVEDERIKNVFLDIAREEKAHVGEFLALLLNIDPEQVSELRDGFEEVEEMTGIKTELPAGDGADEKPDYMNVLREALLGAVENGRVLLKALPRTKMKGAQSYRVDVIEHKDGIRVVKQDYRPIPLLSKKFYIGLRELDDGSFDPAIAVKAGELLVKDEESLIIRELISSDVKKASLGGWESTEEALNDLMNAVQMVGEASSGPFALILNPTRYAKLLRVHEKGGKMLVEVLKQVFRAGIFVTPNIGENEVVVFANTPAVLDVVIGQDVDLKELGPEGDVVAFLATEALALRVKDPGAVVVLK